MAAKKTNFYHARMKADLWNVSKTARLLCVTPEQVEKWDYEEPAYVVTAYIKLWDEKHLPGPDWRDFSFTKGKLRHHKTREYFSGPGILLEREKALKVYWLEQKIKTMRTWRGLFTVFVEKLVDEMARVIDLPMVEIKLTKRLPPAGQQALYDGKPFALTKESD